ncbi:MAG: zf-HC2 domain-containing protein [Candidatus Aminicenantales bacterium]
MKCRQIEELLSPYLENALNTDMKAAIEIHLQSCKSCAILLSLLKETSSSLAEFPELEPSPDLLARLHAIPEKAVPVHARKKKFNFRLDFLLKPSLQPVFAVASVFLIIFSFYFFHPDRKLINQSISRQFHRGYSQIEKLYVKAEEATDNLGAFTDSFIDSLKKLNPLEKEED